MWEGSQVEQAERLIVGTGEKGRAVGGPFDAFEEVLSVGTAAELLSEVEGPPWKDVKSKHRPRMEVRRTLR